MARAPPPSDDEPDVIEFGIPVLDDRLEEASLTFHAERDELVDEAESLAIPYDAGGRTLDLEEALAALDAERFETRNELLEALHPVFEAHRRRSPTGLVAALRSYLPF